MSLWTKAMWGIYVDDTLNNGFSPLPLYRVLPRYSLIWYLALTLCLKLWTFDGVLSHDCAKHCLAICFKPGFFSSWISSTLGVYKFTQNYFFNFLFHFVNKKIWTYSELSEWSSHNWPLISFHSCFGIWICNHLLFTQVRP